MNTNILICHRNSSLTSSLSRLLTRKLSVEIDIINDVERKK